MRDSTLVYIKIEHYIKERVDYGTLAKLGAESYNKFLTKASIEVSRGLFPKKVYGLSREDVRGIIHEMVSDLKQPKVINLDRENLYSFVNNLGNAMFIFADSKKEAVAICNYATGVSLLYWGKTSSMRKVIGISDTGMATLDNGEERNVGATSCFVNMYGHGGTQND